MTTVASPSGIPISTPKAAATESFRTLFNYTKTKIQPAVKSLGLENYYNLEKIKSSLAFGKPEFYVFACLLVFFVLVILVLVIQYEYIQNILRKFVFLSVLLQISHVYCEKDIVVFITSWVFILYFTFLV